MTQMPLAYWCILIAALMPLGLAAYAKAGARDNNAPRDAAARLSGAKRRAYAAHQNSYDNFPFFAVAVIAALAYDADGTALNVLAVLFLCLRAAYAFFYIRDMATPRSAAWLGGLLCTVAIFVLPAIR
jgi:uncharacterized MAPEG superfamily protein